MQNFRRPVQLGIRTFVCILLLSAAAPGRAATIEGVEFDQRTTVDGKLLTLRGTALLRYMVFIKAYVGAFYLEQGAGIENALGDVDRQLVLHYFHSIPAEDFAKATTAMIEKNVSPGRFAAMEPEVEKMNALYRDVEPGDEYTATYISGGGTELALNGKALGVVQGAEFSAAFFSIWIGENPIDKGFRNKLLGK